MSDLKKCALCLRPHRREGKYCSDSHEARAAIPAGAVASVAAPKGVVRGYGVTKPGAASRIVVEPRDPSKVWT